MKNKAFTLIELIAVIVILGIIIGISVPVINNVIEDSKKSAGLTDAKVIFKYLNRFCDTTDLENENMCNGILTNDILNKALKNDSKKVIIAEYDYNNSKFSKLEILTNGYKYIYANGEIVLFDENNPIVPPNPEPDIVYKDSSGANYPELGDNLVPIVYDNNIKKWKYADLSKEWYDYKKKNWANAVVLSDSAKSKKVGDILDEASDIRLWYVWIPRFSYQLFNMEFNSPEKVINIKFENDLNSSTEVTCYDDFSQNGLSEKCNNAVINKWYTHPAFTINKGKIDSKELKGFWVGKFELTGTNSIPTIKSNSPSIVGKNIATYLDIIDVINKNNGFIIFDNHMIKNMEWGAIAYLSHSFYGTCLSESNKCFEIDINSDTNHITGSINNFNQSTTRNVYGVYDMNGGSWEYVMGNMNNVSNNFNPCQSGLQIPLNEKLYDKYKYDTKSDSFSRGKLGDATKEILTQDFGHFSGWYGDTANFMNQTNSWIARGGEASNGESAGIFHFNFTNGSGDYFPTTRVTMIKN